MLGEALHEIAFAEDRQAVDVIETADIARLDAVVFPESLIEGISAARATQRRKSRF
jgi:hypothetical protein